MKLLFSVAVLLVLLGPAANVASADPIVWNLSTLTFNSGGGGPLLAVGGIASGFFSYDVDTNTYSLWDINVSDFGAGFNQGNALATPATSTIQFETPTSFGISYSSDEALLQLYFDHPLTDSGGDVGVFAIVLDAGNTFYSWYASGTASSAVPEPESALLLLGGIACALSIFWHQRRFGKSGSTAKSAGA